MNAPLFVFSLKCNYFSTKQKKRLKIKIINKKLFQPIVFRPKGISNRDDTKLRYGPVKVLEIV
jgi:hypothetical protein